MARTKHRSQLSAIGEINMTPLIDLTFLLLIIFMITAPLLENGIDVSPPEMTASPLKEEGKIVNLNNRGEIVFEHGDLSLDELTAKLADLVNNANPELTVLVRADGDRPYREVMNLMKAVKNAGIKNISLVTQPEE
ncbi:MAG: biopolymer transporter ExbD [Kiritimatiellaeota bacterium]|nr:biopolymer transporter ExbD [Kiritimatiellota bacterium]